MQFYGCVNKNSSFLKWNKMKMTHIYISCYCIIDLSSHYLRVLSTSLQKLQNKIMNYIFIWITRIKFLSNIIQLRSVTSSDTCDFRFAFECYQKSYFPFFINHVTSCCKDKFHKSNKLCLYELLFYGCSLFTLRQNVEICK